MATIPKVLHEHIDTAFPANVCLVGTVQPNGFAQIKLKTGVNHVTGTSGELHISAGSLRSLLSSPIVWGGLVLFGLSAVVWLFALSRASLSFAYPFAALSYVLILVFSVLVLHETVQPLRWLGVAFIVTGIVLVAQTPHT